MILLGINCGFGNSDCGALPESALDLTDGWVNAPRSKTGIPRRCPLWPETVEALRAVLAERREPLDPDAAGLVFLTATGRSWHKDFDDNPISKETRKLLDALGIEGQGKLPRAAPHVRDDRRRGEGPGCRGSHHGPLATTWPVRTPLPIEGTTLPSPCRNVSRKHKPPGHSGNCSLLPLIALIFGFSRRESIARTCSSVSGAVRSNA